MIKNDRIINSLIYGDAVHKLAAERNIGLTEARLLLSQMSFVEYRRLEEVATAITPPSGNTISPVQQSAQKATSNPQKMKAIWPGKGAPVEMGMTVGLKGPSGLPVPGEISQIDATAKGVKVKNPTTGQDEWMNMDQLQPYMVGGQQSQNSQTNAGAEYKPITTVEDATQLTRLRELAGIKETCSAGATGAGSIAVAPAAMGGMRKRQPTVEVVKKEYTPKEPAKTIVGDTKPSQASGELSANLAARGKKSAGRINNGFKR